MSITADGRLTPENPFMRGLVASRIKHGANPVLEAIAAAQVPHKLRRRRLSDLSLPHQQRAVGLLQAWAEFGEVGERPGLILHGPTGTGKTSLAAAALLARIEHTQGQERCRWVDVSDEIDSMRRNIGAKLNGEEIKPTPLSQIAIENETVVLDDLGAERETDFAVDQLYQLCNMLDRQERRVIITTNAPLDDIRSTVPRIYSRLRGLCSTLDLSGPDLRETL